MPEKIDLIRGFLEQSNIMKEDELKQLFKCPISLRITSNPALVIEDEFIFIFDYTAIIKWLRHNNVNPLTKKVINTMYNLEYLIDFENIPISLIQSVITKISTCRQVELIEEIENISWEERHEMLVHALENNDNLLMDLLVVKGGDLASARARLNQSWAHQAGDNQIASDPSNSTMLISRDIGFWNRESYNIGFQDLLDHMAVEILFNPDINLEQLGNSDIDFVRQLYYEFFDTRNGLNRSHQNYRPGTPIYRLNEVVEEEGEDIEPVNIFNSTNQITSPNQGAAIENIIPLPTVTSSETIQEDLNAQEDRSNATTAISDVMSQGAHTLIEPVQNTSQSSADQIES